MNFDLLGQKPIRIMWSQRDPALRKSGVGNIFIKSLDKSIDNKILYDTFSTFGNILSCKVVQDEEGRSRGFGFVHYETEEAAKMAINKVNGMLLNNKKVFVGRFVPRKEREKQLGERAKRFTNVFVKNFGDEIQEDKQLEDMFKEFGEIASAFVAREEGKDEGKSLGFGFVAFKNAEDAEKAVEAMNGKTINGKELYVGRAQKKAERQAELRKKFEESKAQRINKYSGVNLYVKNLDDQIDDEKLKREFQAFGKITSAKVMTDSNGRSKGFGFVCFSSPEEATKAVTDMNGKIVVAKPLYVALAQRKDDRRQQLLTQQYQRVSQMATSRQPPAGGPAMHPLHHAGPLAANPMLGQQPLNPMSQGGVPGVGPAHSPYMAMPPNFPPYQKFQYPGHPQNPMQARPRWGATPQPMPRGPYMMRASPAVHRVASPGQRAQAPSQSGRPIVSTQARPPNRHAAPILSGPRPPAQVNQQPVAYGKYGSYMPPAPMAPVPSAAPNIPVPDQQNQVNAVNVQGHEPLTAKMLAGADDQTQKDMLGERLYPLVSNYCPSGEVGKVTGMLLEISNDEILHMLEHSESLISKIEEALAVLRDRGAPKS